MTAVSLGRAGSGESYRIERVYLDAEQTYGIALVEPVQATDGMK